MAWWRARGRGSARIRNRGEWLLRVCSRLEEGVARREGKGLLRMRTNDPSTRPYSSWEPSQSFASTRAYRESNCDPSRPTRELGRGKEKKNGYSNLLVVSPRDFIRLVEAFRGRKTLRVFAKNLQ